MSLSQLLAALGVPGCDAAAWSEALAVLEDGNARWAPHVPEADNAAKQMARALVGRIVVVVAGAGWPSAVARRWKGQINENAKTLAVDQTLPESNHNEIVGWQVLGDLHARVAAVFLEGGEERAEVVRRAEVTRAILGEEGVTTLEARAQGTSSRARLVSLVQFGDWVSYYLAILAGADPTPIAKIDRLKKALAANAR